MLVKLRPERQVEFARQGESRRACLSEEQHDGSWGRTCLEEWAGSPMDLEHRGWRSRGWK